MIRDALTKIGKNKAPSYDGMMDVIFQKKYYKNIRLKGMLPDEDNKEEVNWHTQGVREELIKKLKKYMNYCIKYEKKLLYN